MSSYNTLMTDLKNGRVKQVYLFFGEDFYFAEKILSELEQICFTDEGMKDFNYDIFDGERTSLTSVLEATLILPVFAERRLVVVKNASWLAAKKKTLKEEDGEIDGEEEVGPDDSSLALHNYLENPCPSTVLVLFVPGSVDKRKKFYKTIAQHQAFLEGKDLKGQELRFFIQDYLKQQGKEIDERALALIINRQQEGTQFLEKELEKLVSYVGASKKINQSDVENILTLTIYNTIFDLTDAVGAKDAPKALWLFRKMLQEGENIFYISSMLVFQLRLIIQAKELLEKKITHQQIINSIKGSPYPIKKAIAQSKNFAVNDLILALEKLLEADVSIKLGKGEPKTVFEQTLFELCH
ncbi:MAG: DNA polymerase III subunit delta [Bacillota bacterium]